MMRKIIKVINEKILGSTFEVFTAEEEQHIIKKY